MQRVTNKTTIKPFALCLILLCAASVPLTANAQTQTAAHTAWMAKHPGANLTVATLEKCKYTAARVPFQLEQPEREGVKVVFTDVTAEVFPRTDGAPFSGPATRQMQHADRPK